MTRDVGKDKGKKIKDKRRVRVRKNVVNVVGKTAVIVTEN